MFIVSVKTICTIPHNEGYMIIDNIKINNIKIVKMKIHNYIQI